MSFETKLCDKTMKESFEIKNVKFYCDRDLYEEMKMVEEFIYNIYFDIKKYTKKYIQAKDENKIRKMKIRVEKRLSYIQENLSTIDNHSLVYEDSSDEYYRDLVFDQADTVSRKIFEQKLENDNALGLPFKEYSFFYWKLDKILETFYNKMKNMIEL